MIKSASFANFKSIKQTSLELAPLTILTGYNSSGKSNILEALSLFGQATRLRTELNIDEVDYHRLFYDGDVRYPRNLIEYIPYNKFTQSEIEIKLNYELNLIEINNIYNQLIKLSQNYEILDKLNNYENGIETIGYSYIFNFENNYTQKLYVNREVIAEFNSNHGNRIIIFPPDNLTMSGDPRNILHSHSFSVTGGHNLGVQYIADFVQFVYSLIREKAGRTYYLSSERGSIISEKKTTGINRDTSITWVGHRTENTLELLSDSVLKNPEAFERIAYWAHRFSLFDLRAGMDKDYVLSSRFRDDKSNVLFNTFLSGLGAIQMLSIITQIFYSFAGDTILIEEPEITLHPKYQVLLHELFAEAIHDGKQIVCTTHSPFFVLAVSKIIRNNRAKLEDVMVYDVSKTNVGTDVTRLTLNKDGFVEGGVESFASVEADLYQEWMDSISLDEE